MGTTGQPQLWAGFLFLVENQLRVWERERGNPRTSSPGDLSRALTIPSVKSNERLNRPWRYTHYLILDPKSQYLTTWSPMPGSTFPISSTDCRPVFLDNLIRLAFIMCLVGTIYQDTL